MKTKAKILLSFLSVVLISSVSALGGVGGTPVSPNDPERPNWFVYNLNPGETYEDVMIVKNHEKQTWLVDMYPADTVKSAGGGFALKQKSEEMKKMGTWIKLSKNQVLLEPGESKKVPFTISIPEEVEPGETAGAIMMVKLDPNTKETSTDMKQGGIKLTFRTGVRVYNTVPGEVIEELNYDYFNVEKRKRKSQDEGIFAKVSDFLFPNFSKNNYLLVSQIVGNEGNISTFAKYNVEVKNKKSVPLAALVLPETGKEGDVLYEQNDSRFLISRDSQFENNHQIDYYNQNSETREYKRQLPYIGKIELVSRVSMINREGEEVFVEEKAQSLWIIPWQEIFIGLGLLLLLLLYMIWRAIRYSSKGWVEYKVKEGDNIEKVASKYPGYSWQRIAKVNKLKSPYLLETDQVILVPPVKPVEEPTDEPQEA